MTDQVTGKGNADTLKEYWLTGEGAAKIRWGEPHDFDRCVKELTEHAPTLSDPKGYCADLHHDALGVWPGQEDKHATVRAAADPAPLVTLPGVDIIAAGDWGLSTGPATFTTEDLAAAVAAAECPAVGPPLIKLGHVDPRFDGEPAVGKVTNLTLTASGNKITGDLAGMPAWLGDVMPSAYPNRSIEGTYGFVCQIGHLHPFVITALALLGVASPGVGVLNSLDDVGALYGVAAAADPGHPWKLTISGGQMANQVLAAGLTTEDIRRAYYDQPNISYAMWITELQLNPLQLIVADESTNQVFRVPVTAKGSSLTFGDPVPVSVEYVDVPKQKTAAALRFASKEESRKGIEAAGWDGGAAEKNLGDSPPSAALKKLYALPADTKGDSKLPHHDVSADGSVGEPNAAACSAAIGAINGAHGGMKGVSPADAKAAYTHLAAHLTALGQEPPEYSGPAAASSPEQDALARLRDVREQVRDAVSAQAGGVDGSVAQLVTALDATLDQVQALIPADTSSLPDDVTQAIQLIGSAESISDELMSLLNIPDPDSGSGDRDPATNAARRLTARHGGANVTHSHPHSAFGQQGDDAMHDHEHTHSGDGTHNHAHARAATGTTRKGGSEVELTEEQITALRAHLALGETGDLTPEVLVTAVEALRVRADAKVAAGAKHLPEGVIAIEREAWDELNRRVAAGEAFRRKQAVAERDTVIAAAIEQGKFTPARRQHWVRLWDADPEGTRIVLAGLQRNVVPLEDIGSGGGGMADELLDDEYKRLFPPGMIRDTES